MEDNIYKYLNDLMSDSDRLEFEKELETNPSLAEDVELEKVIQGAVVDAGLLGWQSDIKTGMSEVKKSNKIKKIAVLSIGLILLGGISYLAVKKDWGKSVKKQEDNVSVVYTNPSSIVEDKVTSTSAKKVEKELSQVVVKSKPQDVKAKTLATEEVEEYKQQDTIVEQVNINSFRVSEEAVPEEVGHVDIGKKVESEMAPDPCLTKDFKLNIETTPACYDKDNGTLIIHDNSLNKKGNTYLITSSYNTYSWQSSSVFEHLIIDDYKISVKDQDGCVYSLDEYYSVDEKNCYQPEKGFNPQVETWEYEGEWQDEATIIIYDRLQNIVVETQVSDTFEWNGNNDQGELLPVGQYLYIIKQNGKQDVSGFVTITY